MKTLKIILVLIVLLAGPAMAQEMGSSSGHDLDALWSRAQKQHDLDTEDAVVLLESRTVTVGDEGTLTTRTHRVVWISTARGIRAYADLRVPWNSASSTLDVEVLRTWRDGRWWPDRRRISDTAVVHTTPYAVNRAHDYTTMRETMLLHDGVELPCIMETAYTVSEQGPPTVGADGVFVFPQIDPAVLTEYVVRLPAAVDVRFASLNGAPEPRDDSNGVRSLTWRVEDSPALKRPIAGQTAAYEPAVVWSTWEDWSALESTWSGTVEAAAVADSALAAALDEHLAGSLDPVRDTVAFWNESVRPIHYPFAFWKLAPRSATRTWETGFGHALDRAVLLKAMLEHVAAGHGCIDTQIVCTRTESGRGEVARDLARLSGFDGVRVEVARGDLVAWIIDADSGEILDGTEADRWSPTSLATNPPVGLDQHLGLSLAPGDDDSWTGTGVLRLGGDADADRGQVEAAVHSVLPEAEITDLATEDGAVRFDVSLAAWPTDADERPTLTLGRLAGGIMDRLPGDVHLAEERRESPVRLPWPLSETVELRLEVGDREVSAPASFAMAGPACGFAVEVTREHGWLRVVQRLSLGGDEGSGSTVIAPDGWPELRDVLLEAGEPEHGTIVLE